MASTMPKKPVKQLAELLQEQQEPFVLEVYLFERGYLRKSLSSKGQGSSSCCSNNSSKVCNRSSSWGLNKSKNKKGSLSCSRILRSGYNKLVSRHSRPSNKGCEKKEVKLNAANTETLRSSKEIGESDRFSSASSRTQYDSCSDGDKDEEASVSLQDDHKTSLAADASHVSKPCNTVNERKIDRFKVEPWKTHCKQQSPSVLENIPSHTDGVHKLHAMSREEDQSPKPSTCNFILPNKTTVDSKLSASLWELLFHPALEKPRASGVSEKQLQPVIRPGIINPSPQRVLQLQQTRQLLFDCVREMTETHAKKEGEQQYSHRRFLGAEEIGKLIHENLEVWGKRSGNEANINSLLEFDLLGSTEERSSNYQEKREIGNEIGDVILEDIINEIVDEM